MSKKKFRNLNSWLELLQQTLSKTVILWNDDIISRFLPFYFKQLNFNCQRIQISYVRIIGRTSWFLSNHYLLDEWRFLKLAESQRLELQRFFWPHWFSFLWATKCPIPWIRFWCLASHSNRKCICSWLLGRFGFWLWWVWSFGVLEIGFWGKCRFP